MNELPSLSTLDAWCDNCRALKQELEDVRQEHALSYVALKDKIISTDKLIKQYTSKCQKYDALSKKLEEMGKTSDGYKRNCETLEAQLKAMVEEVEPLRKSVQRLERGKEKHEAQVLELKNQLNASKAGKHQDDTMMRKMVTDYNKLEDDFKQQKTKFKDLEAKLRKSEERNKRLLDEQQQRRSEFLTIKREKSQLAQNCTKYKEILLEREQLLRRHGIHFRTSKFLRKERSGDSHDNFADADSDDDDEDDDEDDDKDGVKKNVGASPASQPAASPRRAVHVKMEGDRDDEVERLRHVPIDAMFAKIFADLGNSSAGRGIPEFCNPLSPALSMMSSDGEADDEAVDSAAELVESELLDSPEQKIRASRRLQRSASTSDVGEKPAPLRRSLRGRRTKMVPSSLASHGMLELQESVSDPEQDGTDTDALLPFTEFKNDRILTRELALSSSDSDSDTPFNNDTPPPVQNSSKAIVNDNVAKRCPNKGYGKLGAAVNSQKNTALPAKTSPQSDDGLFKAPLPVSPRRSRGRLRTVSDSSNESTSPRRVTRSMSSPALTSHKQKVVSKDDDSPPTNADPVVQETEKAADNLQKPQVISPAVGPPLTRQRRRLSFSETSSESEGDEPGPAPLRRRLRSSSASSDDGITSDPTEVKVTRKSRLKKRNTERSDPVKEMDYAGSETTSEETKKKMTDSSSVNEKVNMAQSQNEASGKCKKYAGFVSGGMLQDSIGDTEQSPVKEEVPRNEKQSIKIEQCTVEVEKIEMPNSLTSPSKKQKLSHRRRISDTSAVDSSPHDVSMVGEKSGLNDDVGNPCGGVLGPGSVEGPPASVAAASDGEQGTSTVPLTRSRRLSNSQRAADLSKKDGMDAGSLPSDNVPKSVSREAQHPQDSISSVSGDATRLVATPDTDDPESQMLTGDQSSDASTGAIHKDTFLSDKHAAAVTNNKNSRSPRAKHAKSSIDQKYAIRLQGACPLSDDNQENDKLQSDRVNQGISEYVKDSAELNECPTNQKDSPKRRRKSDKYLSRQLSLHSDGLEDDVENPQVNNEDAVLNQIAPPSGPTNSPQALTSTLLSDHKTAFTKWSRRMSEPNQDRLDPAESTESETGHHFQHKDDFSNVSVTVSHSELPAGQSIVDDDNRGPAEGTSDGSWPRHSHVCTPKVICSEQGEPALGIDDGSLGSVEFTSPLTSSLIPYDQSRHFVSLANRTDSPAQNSDQLEISPVVETPTSHSSHDGEKDADASDPPAGAAMQGSPTSFSISPSSVGEANSILSSLPPSPGEQPERMTPVSPLSSDGHHSDAVSPLSFSDTETIGDPLSPLPPTPGTPARTHTPPEDASPGHEQASVNQQEYYPAMADFPLKESDSKTSAAGPAVTPPLNGDLPRRRTRSQSATPVGAAAISNGPSSTACLKENTPPSKSDTVSASETHVTDHKSEQSESSTNVELSAADIMTERRRRVAHSKGSKPVINPTKKEPTGFSMMELVIMKRQRKLASSSRSKLPSSGRLNQASKKRTTRSMALKDIKHRLKSGLAARVGVVKQSNSKVDPAVTKDGDTEDKPNVGPVIIPPVIPAKRRGRPKRSLSEDKDQGITKETSCTDDVSSEVEDSSPPKKPKVVDFKVLERELSFLTRFRSVQAHFVCDKLQSLLPHADAQDIADMIVKILLVNEADLLTTAYTTCSKMRDNLSEWKPLLAEHEVKFIELIMLLSAKPHLHQLSEAFLCGASHAILRTDVVTILGKVSLMRVFTAVCYQTGAVERLRVMIYDLAMRRSSSFFSLLTGAACVWPEVLRKGTENGEDPVLEVLESVTFKISQSKPSHTKIIHCLQILLSWSLPVLDSTGLMRQLLKRLGEVTSANNQEAVFSLVRAMELLLTYENWEWINNTLIIDIIWPMLHEWLIQRYASTINQTTVEILIRLLGFAAQRCPAQYVSALQEILKTLAALLGNEQVTDVPVAVQLASVEALLQMAPYEPLRVAIPCYNWLKQNEHQTIADTVVKHNLAEFAKYYRHRLVGLDLQVFGVSEAELLQ